MHCLCIIVSLMLSQDIKRDTPTDLDTPGTCLLCPTVWTVRGVSLNNIFENYSCFCIFSVVFVSYTLSRERTALPNVLSLVKNRNQVCF